jgi:hypothetical protein
MDEGRYGRPEADEFERSRLHTVTELSAALQGWGGAHARGDIGDELFSAEPGDFPHHTGFSVLFPLVLRSMAAPRSQSLGDYSLRGDCGMEHPTGSLERVLRNWGPAPAHIRVQVGIGFFGAAALQNAGITAHYFGCQLRWLCRFCGHEDGTMQRNWSSDDALSTDHVYGLATSGAAQKPS